jgi:hypothetical protein
METRGNAHSFASRVVADRPAAQRRRFPFGSFAAAGYASLADRSTLERRPERLKASASRMENWRYSTSTTIVSIAVVVASRECFRGAATMMKKTRGAVGSEGRSWAGLTEAQVSVGGPATSNTSDMTWGLLVDAVRNGRAYPWCTGYRYLCWLLTSLCQARLTMGQDQRLEPCQKQGIRVARDGRC